MPLTYYANKAILKQTLKANFRPHIALYPNLQIYQPFTQIARTFFRFR